MATVPRDFDFKATSASASSGLKVIDVSDKPLKSNVVRQGKQVRRSRSTRRSSTPSSLPM